MSRELFLLNEDRFWGSIDRPDEGCWPWRLRLDVSGYGVFGIGPRKFYAHRVAFALAHRDVPQGLFVLHACDTPACCHPGHLSVGSHADNMADMAAKGRAHRWGGKRRGSANPAARLTEREVDAIRRRLAAGEAPALIAPDFETSQSTIFAIRAGHKWSGYHG